MKRVLVIGGTGTMGRPMVTALHEKGYDLTVVCRKEVHDDRNNIKYCYGNAKDLAFISSVLSDEFDVIVDFCWYSSKEFASNYKTLLDKTRQYICLSSAAVYSDVPTPKDEQSPRYLDIEHPIEGTPEYNWYCYEKARIEDILLRSDFRNWTIVRPGTTMNANHFGWGHDWNADWALRIMQGKKVIVPVDMLPYKFSLSYGGHVVTMLLALIGNEKAIGQIFNVNSPEVFSWQELLDFYKEVFKQKGYFLKTKEVKSQDLIERNPALKYWYERARLLDRVFDSSKAYSLMGDNKIAPPMRQLLEGWINDYIAANAKMKIADSALWHTAWIDRITKDTTSYKYFSNSKAYVKYLIMRYAPSLWNMFFYRIVSKRK